MQVGSGPKAVYIRWRGSAWDAPDAHFDALIRNPEPEPGPGPSEPAPATTHVQRTRGGPKDEGAAQKHAEPEAGDREHNDERMVEQNPAHSDISEEEDEQEEGPENKWRPDRRTWPGKVGPKLRILTVNVGGAREAIHWSAMQEVDILLIQEHRLLGPQAATWKARLRGWGWGSVWSPAVRTQRGGISGGVAVAARGMLLIGPTGRTSERIVTGHVALTRTRRLRVTSLYLADSTCPNAHGTNFGIAQTLEEELRGEGRVPFVVGGDWNCEPSTGRCWWGGPGRLVAPLEATTRFHKTFDWFVVGAGLRMATAAAKLEWVVEDHRAVLLEATGWQGNQLGQRQLPARPVDLTLKPGDIDYDAEDAARGDDYERWTEQADRWLVQAYGDPQQKGAVRGHKPRRVNNTLGAPQDLGFGAGNETSRALALRVRRARHLARIRQGAPGSPEHRALELMAARDLANIDALEQEAAQAAAEAKKTRIQGWKDWARDHRGRKPLYTWAKRVALPVAEETLDWGEPNAPLHIPARVKRADDEWGALWQQGEEQPALPREPLKPITAGDIARALKRARDKAMGPDQWQVSELRALPAPFLTGLARIFTNAERAGRWPDAMKQVTVALLPKDGARHEGQLRPIGLTPVIYRVYTMVRGGILKRWRQRISAEPNRGAVELAWRARVQDELAQYHGRHRITTFLDCSKCYERVSHKESRRAAVEAGLPPSVANLVWDLYGGPRRIRVHGAVGKEHRPANGLVAGCPAAKDILEAYLGPIARVTEWAVVRQYVDDFCVSVERGDPHETANTMSEEVNLVKEALRRQGMVLNDGKEQLLITTAAGRKAWTQVEPNYVGKVTPTAKDLGVCQRRRGTTNRVAAERAKPLGEVCRRIGYLPLERKDRITMAVALVGGAGLYGAEVDKPTQKIFQALRVAMGRAAWGDKGPKNRRAALLLQQGGRAEPYVMWARRLAAHWARMGKAGLLAQEEIRTYWEDLTLNPEGRRRKGPARGPIQEMHRALTEWGIESDGPTRWKIDGRWTQVRAGPTLQTLIQKCETDRQWGYLGRTRYNLHGLQGGRDTRLSELHLKRQKTPKGKAETIQVLSDGWFTPMRGHQLRGGDHHCARCGAEYADVEHIVWECPIVATRQAVHRRLKAARAEVHGHPRALWLSGNVPSGYLPAPQSAQMRTESLAMEAEDYREEGEQWVGTDGGCRKTPGGPRAGAGVAWEHGPAQSWAVPGSGQTAQEAEVFALCCAVRQARKPLVVVTDSRYVHNTTQRIMADPSYEPSEHGHWWEQIRERFGRIRQIRWQKAHLTMEQNAARGGSERDWTLNCRADTAATQGVELHQDDPEHVKLYTQGILQIADIQTHIQHRLREYAAEHPTRYAAPGQLVRRTGRAKREGRRGDPLPGYKARHRIQADPKIEWCSECGRHTKTSGKRHAQMKVWREPCRETAQFSQARARGHQPGYENGAAKCQLCDVTVKGWELQCLGRQNARIDGGHALASDYGHEVQREGQKLTCRVCLWSVNGAGVNLAAQHLWAKGCDWHRGHRIGTRRGHDCRWDADAWKCLRCQADWTLAEPCAGSSKHKRGAAQHVISETGTHNVCHGCGHHTSAVSTRNAQKRVWGRPCVPTRQFAWAGRYGHDPEWADTSWQCRLCGKLGHEWASACEARQRPNFRIRGKQPDPQAEARRVRARTRGTDEGPMDAGPRERDPGEHSDTRPREAMPVDAGDSERKDPVAGTRPGNGNRRRARSSVSTTPRRVQARGRGTTPRSAAADAPEADPKRVTDRADRLKVPGHARPTSRDRQSQERGQTRSPRGNGARGGQDARAPSQRDCGEAMRREETHRTHARTGRARACGSPFSSKCPQRGRGEPGPGTEPGARGRTRPRESPGRTPVSRSGPSADAPTLPAGQAAARDAPAMGAAAAPVTAPTPQTGERRDRSRPRGRSRGGTKRHQTARTPGDRQPGARQKSDATGDDTRTAPGVASGTSRGEG